MSNKMVKGAAIIGIAGIIVKFLGAFFRIPLTNWIGDVGMSYYGFAYTIYGVLLIMSTAGLPLAISRLVSESIARKEYANAHKIFKISLMLMFTVGIISSAICFFGSGLITKALGNPDAKFALMAISPALLFVPMLSAFRGYFQGRQNMNPTAISEIMEQFIRVIAGLVCAGAFLAYGLKEAAAGAAFGASAGSLVALIIIFLIYMANKKVIKKKIRLNDPNTESTKSIIKQIVVIAIPIILGSELVPIMGLIDMTMIMKVLMSTGWTYEAAKGMYGILSGFCNSLIAFPQIFTQAVAISLVPAIAHGVAQKDKDKVRTNVALGYRTTMIMAFPCAVGLFVMAKPILLLLYPMQRESALEAVPTLMIMAIGVVSLAISQTSTGILQAIGKQVLPVKHLAVGCAFKVVLTYLLVSIPAINIKGAAIGTILAETISFILNNRSVRKYTGIKLDYKKTYVKPFLASAVMGAVAFGMYKLSSLLLGNSIATLLTILVSALVYAITIFAIKAITVDEIENIKGGAKVAQVVRKFIK